MELITFLKTEIDSKDKEMFIVVSNEVAGKKSWLKDPDSYRNEPDNIEGRGAQILQLKDILPVVPGPQTL